MSSKLRAHLGALATKSPSAKSLESQWNMDHEMLSKALSYISRLFGHFSMHDASHSESILEKIEMFLGDDGINALTATDTWLLLEAAYWHDVGMLVSHDEFIRLFKEEAFKEFLDSITASSNHELYDVALAVKQEDASFFSITPICL